MDTVIRVFAMIVGFAIMVSIGYGFTTWQYWVMGVVFVLMAVSHVFKGK